MTREELLAKIEGMTQTDKDGWSGVAVSLLLACGGLAIWFEIPAPINIVGPFISGLMIGLAFAWYGIMRQRQFWNKLYGRDLWDPRALPPSNEAAR